MTNLSKKHCVNCGSCQTIKWGFQDGKKRFRCKNCNKVFYWTNTGSSKNQKLKLFKKWVVGKATLNELAHEIGKSISTLQRIFKNFMDYPPLQEAGAEQQLPFNNRWNAF